MVYKDNQRKSMASLDSTKKQGETVKKVIFEVRNSRNLPYKKTKHNEHLIKKLKKIRKRLYKSELQKKSKTLKEIFKVFQGTKGEENILCQGKVLIELSEMRKICFSNKWSVTQKTIILFNIQ